MRMNNDDLTWEEYLHMYISEILLKRKLTRDEEKILSVIIDNVKLDYYNPLMEEYENII